MEACLPVGKDLSRDSSASAWNDSGVGFDVRLSSQYNVVHGQLFTQIYQERAGS